MIKAVISGSYHRDVEGFCRLFKELETCGVRILSPLSLQFNDTTKRVVRTDTDENLGIDILETLHLRAIREADILFIHAPNGYIGVSTSFEIGYALAKGVPVFSTHELQDEMLRCQIKCINSVFNALTASELI